MEIHGRLGNVVGTAELIFSHRDSPIGVVCPSSTVRAVLHDSKLFRQEEVARWTEAVRAPINRNIKECIFRTVMDRGLAYKSTGSFSRPAERIAINTDSEGDEPFKWARKGTVLEDDDDRIWEGKEEDSSEPPLVPSIVRNTMSRHETHLLLFPQDPEALASSWPKFIYSSKVGIDELPFLTELLPLEVGRQLLYRGHRNRRKWFRGLAYGQRPDWGITEEDFGNGIYFTPDLELAILYAGRGGIVQVVDFSNEGEGLFMKIFDSEGDDQQEWERFTKASICFGTSLEEEPPERYDDDVLIGPICANHEEVMMGGSPKRGMEVQVVARSDSACDYMSMYTVAVIYVV